jgi:transcription elongation factor GreA-like protein
MSIYDLDAKEAFQASTNLLKDLKRRHSTSDQIKEAIDIVGGRLSYLNKVVKAKDILEMAKHLKSVEKAWLLSQIGLIPDCDDDVMDEVCLRIVFPVLFILIRPIGL